MSFKSGMRAAARQGIATSAIQVGPRGGRFYFNGSGHKVYGTPPTPQAPHAPMASAMPAAKGGERLAVPPHVFKGAKVQVDLDEEGWLHGTVVRVDTKRGIAKVKLADGGTADAPFESTRAPRAPKTGYDPTTPKPPPKPPGKPLEHLHKGKEVEVDLDTDGWIRGHIVEVNKRHVKVALVDGTFAKAPHDTIREPQGAHDPNAKVGIDRFVKGAINGNPEFKWQIAKAIKEGGFEPFLLQHPLTHMTEGGAGRGNMGVYRRNLRGDQSINIMREAKLEDQAALTRMTNSGGGISLNGTPNTNKLGPNVRVVSNVAASEVTGADLHHATLIHEISHHLHLHNNHDLGMWSKASNQEQHLDHQIHEHYRSQKYNSGWVPSRYSTTNHHEWFAEAHTAYVLHKKEFREADPKGFALIQEWRKMKGMQP